MAVWLRTLGLVSLLVGGAEFGFASGSGEAKPASGHETPAKAEGHGAEGGTEGRGEPSSTLPAEAPQLQQGRVFTETETVLLMELDKQRIELDRRAQALELREKLVDLMQQRLNQRVAELTQLKVDLEKLMVSVSGRDDKELISLAAMYGAMKPAAAAPVLNKLENGLVVDILNRLPAKKSAKLMEAIDPIKARALSDLMATKTVIPATSTTTK